MSPVTFVALLTRIFVSHDGVGSNPYTTAKMLSAVGVMKVRTARSAAR